MDTELLKKVLLYIDEHIQEKISLTELAEVAGYSPATSSENPAEMLDFLCVKVFTLFYTVLWSGKSRLRVMMYAWISRNRFLFLEI